MYKPESLSLNAYRILTLLRNLAIGVLAAGMGLGMGYALGEGKATWPLTVVGLSVYVLVIVVNPLGGLLLWIVTAPFSRFIYLDILMGRGIPDLTLTRLCAGLLMVMVMAQLATGKLRAPKSIVLDGLVLAVLIGVGAALPATLEDLKLMVTNYSDAYLIPGIIYFLARFLVRERRHAEAICTAFIIMGVILTTVAVHEQLSGTVLFVYSERSWVYTKDIHRLAGLLGSPAFFATLITMAGSFAVYRFSQARLATTRAIYSILAVYTAIGVYYTYNRAGWLSLALNLAIMALAWPTFRRWFVAAVITAIFVLALSWGTVQRSPVVTQRLTASGPIGYRMEIWSRAAFILAHNPIFGLGYANFGRVYARYNPAWATVYVLPAPHNSFLEVLFNTGLVGAVPYAAMFVAIALGAVRFYRRARDQTEAALILTFTLAILAYVIQAMFVDMIAAHYVNMVMMLAVGSLFGWQTRDNKEHKETHAGCHPGAVSS